MTAVRQRLLVAGLTGQLGHGLIEVLHAGEVEIVPLVRPIGHYDASMRIESVFPDHPELAQRAVSGDVSASLWGLSESSVAELQGQIDVVLSLACETNWAAPKRALNATNVLGAIHGHALAEALTDEDGAAPVYCWTSSIFAAGATRGLIGETPFPPGASRTAYEHSKWLGEQALLRRAREGSSAPVVIARIGGLLGNSTTGATAKRNALYMMRDAWERTPYGLFPLADRGRVDTLPRDTAAAALLGAIAPRHTATLRDGDQARIVHVCAGETAPTAGMLFSAIRGLQAHGGAKQPRPIPLPESTLVWLSENLHRAQRMSPSTHNMIAGSRYLSLDRIFDRANLARLLDGALPTGSAELLARLLLESDVRRASAPIGDPQLARYAA